MAGNDKAKLPARERIRLKELFLVKVDTLTNSIIFSTTS